MGFRIHIYSILFYPLFSLFFWRCLQDARADLFLLARHVAAHTDTHEPPLWFLKTFCTLLGEVFPPGANQAYLY